MALYARGTHAVGHCAKSGRKMLLRNMVEDPFSGLMVDPAWADEKERRVTYPTDDPEALFKPAPDLDSPGETVNIGRLFVVATGVIVPVLRVQYALGNVTVTVA